MVNNNNYRILYIKEKEDIINEVNTFLVTNNTKIYDIKIGIYGIIGIFKSFRDVLIVDLLLEKNHYLGVPILSINQKEELLNLNYIEVPEKEYELLVKYTNIDKEIDKNELLYKIKSNIIKNKN